MGRKTIAENSADPFLQTLEGRDGASFLTECQVSGYTQIATTTLQEWRDQRRSPPIWVRIPGFDGVRYPLGKLREWVNDLIEEHVAAVGASSMQSAPTLEETSAVDKVRQAGGNVKDYGLDSAIIRGGRRAKVKQNNFSQFLAHGSSTDEWVFAMVPSPYPNVPPRPVDLIATLDMDLEELSDATCEQLNLVTFSESMAAHARALFAAERQARTPGLPEGDPDAPPPRGGREYP